MVINPAAKERKRTVRRRRGVLKLQKPISLRRALLREDLAHTLSLRKSQGTIMVVIVRPLDFSNRIWDLRITGLLKDQ